MDEQLLPEEFRDLAPYLNWALASESERCARRQASTYAELQDFYQNMLSRMPRILPYLDRFSDEAVPPDVERLFFLTLSLAEVAPAIENFQQVSVPEGYDVFRFTPVALYPATRTAPAHNE